MFGEDCIVGEAYGGKETALREWQLRHADETRYCLISVNRESVCE